MSDTWPFADPPNTAVFTTRSVLEGGEPILRVTHDQDDSGWQFHAGRQPMIRDAMIVALEEVVEHDPSVAQLADLEIGWVATRESVDAPWRRQPREEAGPGDGR